MRLLRSRFSGGGAHKMFENLRKSNPSIFLPKIRRVRTTFKLQVRRRKLLPGRLQHDRHGVARVKVGLARLRLQRVDHHLDRVLHHLRRRRTFVAAAAVADEKSFEFRFR